MRKLVIAGIAVWAMSAPMAAAQDECGDWVAASFSADLGFRATINKFLAFDIGGEPRLIAFGQGLAAGGTTERGYAIWDGQRWTPGEPMARAVGSQGIARDAAVFEIDGQPHVIMVGNFDLIGLQTLRNVAAFDGQAWEHMGEGLRFIDESGRVNSVEVVGSGASAVLYAGGLFHHSDGVTMRNISRWDGTAWQPLQGSSDVGVNGQISDMVAWNGQLAIGGEFTTVGGLPADGVATWNGSAWTPLPPAPGDVVDLEVFRGDLYASALIGNDARIFRLAGTRWIDVAPTISYDDGRFLYTDQTEDRLYFGGRVETPGVATTSPCYWDGSEWLSMPLTLDRGVISFGRGLGLGGDASQLWMFGQFEEVAGIEVDRLAVWDGQDIRAAVGGFDARIRDILVTCSGDDAVVYVAGDFGYSPAGPVGSIAVRRDGQWQSMGDFNNRIYDLIMFDAGDGPQLHACGRFTQVDGQPISGIARWDGSAWQPLEEGIPDPGEGSYVFTMAVYDDGRGPALYVGGQFRRAGVVPVNALARWDGSFWENVGRGTDGDVLDLAVHPFGGQDRLVVAGSFERVGGLAGVDARNLAAWDGTSWYDIAGGTDQQINAVASLRGDVDSSLFVGGEFSEAGGVAAARIAMLTSESEWLSLGTGLSGSGFSEAFELLPVRLDGVESMVVGGLFELADGFIAGSLAAYVPGSGWRNLDGDFTLTTGSVAVVDAIAVDESASRIWAGGDFERVSGMEAVRLAEREIDCGCVADCDGDGSLTIFDFLCFQSAFDLGDPTADCDGDGTLTLFDFLCFQSAFAVGCP